MPLHAEEQFTFHTDGASEANSAERTRRCPPGPTTGPGGAAGVLGADAVGWGVGADAVGWGVGAGAGVVGGAGVDDTYVRPAVSTEEVPSGANTYTS